MRRASRIAYAVVLAAIIVCAVAAQNPAPAPNPPATNPPATQQRAGDSSGKALAILQAATDALGGAAFLNARDFRAEGRAFQFDRDEELRGMARFIDYEKFPGKERQELGKDRDIIFVLNGDKAWDKDFHGVREYPEDEIKRMRENRLVSVEHILRYRMKEPGMNFRLAGTDLIAGRRVDLVEVEDPDNRLVTIAVEQDTRLPVRREWSRRNPQTRVREVESETLGKYRAVNGVQTPHYRMRERDGQKIFEVFLNSAAYNLNLPDSLFQRPPGPERLDPRRKKRP